MKKIFMFPALFALGACCDCANAIKNDPVLMGEVVAAVKQDLVKNPQVLKQMVNSLQEQQAQKSTETIQEYMRDNMDELTENAPIWGDKNATNTIVIWTDHSCPYCRRTYNELARVMKKRDDVRIVLKNLSIHGDLSDAPAKAVIAAKLQSNDKAVDLNTKLMENEYFDQKDMKNTATVGAKIHKKVMAFAKEVGLDTAKLERDMDGKVVKKEVKNVRDLAQKFEIAGTPFLIINGKAFPGALPYDKIMEALDE